MVVISLISSFYILYELNKHHLFNDSSYSTVYSLACEFLPGHDYKPIRTVRSSGDVNGYYCITPEEYKKDIGG